MSSESPRREWLHPVLVSAALALLLAACGGSEEPAHRAREATAATAMPAAATPGKPSATGAGVVAGLEAWNEDLALPATASGLPFNHAFAVPPPAPPLDAEAVIDRFVRECPSGTDSPGCHELRLDVEGLFLEALVALRGSDQEVDRDWYRLAAAAETPQLACLGLRELIYAKDRSAGDEAIAIVALDSPWPGVREAVLSLGGMLPAVKALWQRVPHDGNEVSGTCVDAVRDPVPGAKWAGNYPGARFRAFASSASRRWFTTPDPPEQVIAFFAGQGMPARTIEEMQADAANRFMEAATRIGQSGEEGGEEELMAMIQNMATPQSDWSAPFQGIEGTGPIRYVMLAENQAIAIFRDEVLGATSIVAPRPTPPTPLQFDMEALQREAMARSVLGF